MKSCKSVNWSVVPYAPSVYSCNISLGLAVGRFVCQSVSGLPQREPDKELKRLEKEFERLWS